MLRSEAIAEIKRGLGFRQTQDTTIIAALKSAQEILETGRTLPSWLLVYDQAITVTANSANITLPTDFLRFHDDYDLYRVDSNSTGRIFIPRRNYTEAYQAYVANGTKDDSAVIATTSSYPDVLVMRGKTAGLLIPTPTIGFTAYLTFYKKAAVLSSDVENAWLLNNSNSLIGLAGIKVAGPLRDKGAMELFSTQYKMGQGSFMGDIVEDELAGRPLIMGRNN